MKVKEISVSAVIPNAQYANLQPTVTVEVDDDNVDAAKAEALRHIEQISNQYAETGKALPLLHQDATAPVAKLKLPKQLTSSLTGFSAYFDEVEHVYTNDAGKKLLSGSEFAEKFCPPFDAQMILPKMEAKYGVPAADIQAMWSKKADASCHIGDAIHESLELYGKYKNLGLTLDAEKTDDKKKWPHLHDNPILRQAVVEFFRPRQDEEALYEEFIVNQEATLCGHIDRLLIVNSEQRVVRVQDFKTNGDINKKGSPKFLSAPFTDIENTTLNKYWLQLSFYAHILQSAGWTVEGLDIFHYNGSTWDTYQHDVIDITGAEILKKV